MDLLTFIISHSYWFLLLLFIFEGMAINLISAFGASLGYFDIKIIIVLALIGNTITDNIFYFFGRYYSIVKKNSKKKKIINKLSLLCNKNLFMSLILIKLSGLAPIGLSFIGTTKIKFKEYFYMSFITTLIFVGVFTSLGYYYGSSTKFILRYITIGQYLLFSVILLIFLLFIVIHQLKRKMIT